MLYIHRFSYNHIILYRYLLIQFIDEKINLSLKSYLLKFSKYISSQVEWSQFILIRWKQTKVIKIRWNDHQSFKLIIAFLLGHLICVVSLNSGNKQNPTDIQKVINDVPNIIGVIILLWFLVHIHFFQDTNQRQRS